MFKIIKLSDDLDVRCDDDEVFFKISQLTSSNYVKDTDYERTLAGYSDRSEINLTQRSSWTNKHKFKFSLPCEAEHFFETYSIDTNCEKDDPYDHRMFAAPSDVYTLIKYETGDFFLDHIDRQKNEKHCFTCLIFVHNDQTYEGGDLILHDKEIHIRLLFNLPNLKRLLW